MKKIALTVLAFSFTLFAAPPLLDRSTNSASPVPPEIVEQVAGEGSKGSLQLKVGDKRETVDLGGKSGHYAVGMVIHSSALPAEMAAEFQGFNIIQIFLGTLSTAGAESVPQFGSIGVITKRIPAKDAKTFKTVLGPTSPKTGDYAQVSFKSPGTPLQQTDEEKLKATAFAASGTLRYSPKGLPHEVKVRSRTGYLAFKRQRVSLDVNSILTSPFNPIDGDVKGQLEVYVYWPSRPESQDLTRSLASSSLNDLFTTRMPKLEASPTENVNRAVTGTSKK